MSGGLDQKLQVQQATDIVGLIGEEVSLRPRGREFIGLCPFHDDQNPSLNVSPAKQIYKCFSCGAGGDVFSFVMNYHKMTFPEAMSHLAERAGIKLVWKGSVDAGRSDDRELLAKANDHALRFFQSIYHDDVRGRAARQYVAGRGISEQMVKAFQVGYALDSWDELAKAVGAKGWGVKGFDLAGLVSTRKTGDGWIDRFRHRLIFPIFDGLSRPIAFGARRLREEDEPKYLNSHETALFNKSATLYGLHLAKKPIIDARTAVVVEGYTDVIACHQMGFGNVVATLGTALTHQHVTTLSRLCDRVVLVFDADEAGQKAADRAVEVFLKGSLDVAVAVVEGGKDPGDLLTAVDGAERFRRTIEKPMDALEYKFTRLRGELEQSDTLTGKQRVAERYLGDLIGLGIMEPQVVLRRAMVVGRLASLLGVGQQVVASELDRLGKTRRVVSSGPSGGKPVLNEEADSSLSGLVEGERLHRIRGLRLAERYVLGCLLRQPALFHHTIDHGMALDESLTEGEMITSQGKRLYGRLYSMLSGGQSPTLAALLADLASEGDDELIRLATQADAEVEARCGDDNQRLRAMLQEGAGWILRFHRESRYEQQRPDLLEAVSDAPRGSTQEARLTEVVEHRRENPSAVRIMRLEGRR